ncbi:MAG: hypothetical protein APF84_01410 [Gracilibacter sp. BRH_c7a]|nr:MAG: hypothetical protein APF84_01410 [Gracilibacter sp. BRH_c7a]
MKVIKQRFRVIPVIDLKDGMVVHGVKGERDKYQPLKSLLTSSTECKVVVADLMRKLSLQEFYLADLDAIISSGEHNQFQLIPSKNNSGFNLVSMMVDAGITDKASALKALESGIDRVVIGTETLQSLGALREITSNIESHRLVASIDVQDNRVLSPNKGLAKLTPPEAILEISKTGIREFILLQLSRVGTGSGVDRKLILKCLEACDQSHSFSHLPATLVLGGGVSEYEDLRWLAANGVGGVLIATALHNGSIDQKMIQQLNS